MKYILIAAVSLFSTVAFAAPTISFTQSTKHYKEGQKVVVTATLSELTSVGVSVKVVPGTSTADQYDHDMGEYAEIFIAPNQMTGSFTFNILDDGNIEETETLVLSMTAPLNATLSPTNKTMSIIIGDDAPTDNLPTVAFDTASTTTSEGEIKNIVIKLSAPTDAIVTVNMQVTTNTDESDHTLSLSTLQQIVFNPNMTEVTIPVEFLEDGQIEGDETIELQLVDAVSNAKLGETTSHLITIQDATP